MWGRAQAQPSFGVPFYLCTYPLTQNYQIWRGNTYGRGLIFRGSATRPRRPSQESGVSALPNFWAFPVFMPTPFNDQIRHGNTYGEGRVFRRPTSHSAASAVMRRAVCQR